MDRVAYRTIPIMFSAGVEPSWWTKMTLLETHPWRESFIVKPGYDGPKQSVLVSATKKAVQTDYDVCHMASMCIERYMGQPCPWLLPPETVSFQCHPSDFS